MTWPSDQQPEENLEACHCPLCPSLIAGATDCQQNEAGLQCDQDGQYRASQSDGSSGKAFCVDSQGRRLLWSETNDPLEESQCLSMCCQIELLLEGAEGLWGKAETSPEICLSSDFEKFLSMKKERVRLANTHRFNQK